MVRESINFYWTGDHPPYNLKENLRDWGTVLKLSDSLFKLNLWIEQKSLNHLLNYCPNEIRKISSSEEFTCYRWFINGHQADIKVFTFEKLLAPYENLHKTTDKKYFDLLKTEISKMIILSHINGMFFAEDLKPNFKMTFPKNIKDLKKIFKIFNNSDVYSDPYHFQAYFSLSSRQPQKLLQKLNNEFKSLPLYSETNENALFNTVRNILFSIINNTSEDYKKFYNEKINRFFFSKNELLKQKISSSYLNFCNTTKKARSVYNISDLTEKETALALDYIISSFCASRVQCKIHRECHLSAIH